MNAFSEGASPEQPDPKKHAQQVANFDTGVIYGPQPGVLCTRTGLLLYKNHDHLMF